MWMRVRAGIIIPPSSIASFEIRAIPGAGGNNRIASWITWRQNDRPSTWVASIV
jgi:hypothetical protein